MLTLRPRGATGLAARLAPLLRPAAPGPGSGPGPRSRPGPGSAAGAGAPAGASGGHRAAGGDQGLLGSRLALRCTKQPERPRLLHRLRPGAAAPLRPAPQPPRGCTAPAHDAFLSRCCNAPARDAIYFFPTVVLRLRRTPSSHVAAVRMRAKLFLSPSAAAPRLRATPVSHARRSGQTSSVARASRRLRSPRRATLPGLGHCGPASARRATSSRKSRWRLGDFRPLYSALWVRLGN